MKDIITESLRYWEPRRIGYNLALAGVFVGTFVCHQPASNAGFAWGPFFCWVLAGVLPAVMANVLYCAAYAADIFVQMSDYRDTWKRWRWMLWVHRPTRRSRPPNSNTSESRGKWPEPEQLTPETPPLWRCSFRACLQTAGR